MKLKILRFSDDKKQTLGMGFVIDFINGIKSLLFSFVTIELPWMDNERAVSCIPPGIYKVRKYMSPTHGECFLIIDVPERSMCELHAANFSRQLKGCIAPGESHTDIDHDGLKDVTNSRKTLDRLLELLPEEFELQII